MGLQIGEIDIMNQTLDNEFKILILERLIEFIINNNNSLNKPTQQQIQNIRNEVLQQLQLKYPKSGIEIKD